MVEEGGRFLHANPAIGRLLELPASTPGRSSRSAPTAWCHADGGPLLESEVPHVRAFAGDQEVHDVLHLARPGVPGERIFEVSSACCLQLRRRTCRAP